MNNSFLVQERVPLTLETPFEKEPLQEREAELVKIIENLRAVSRSKEWSSLKTQVFNGLTESLSKELHSEARKENPDTLKLNRLSGQLKWAERYSDLQKLEDEFGLQLKNVRAKLYGKTEKTGRGDISL